MFADPSLPGRVTRLEELFSRLEHTNRLEVVQPLQFDSTDNQGGVLSLNPERGPVLQIEAAGQAQEVLSATVDAGGTGYVVGDILTVSGGTAVAAAKFVVTAVDTGAVLSVSSVLGSEGVYTDLPANPASVTGGTGTGATLTVIYDLTGYFDCTLQKPAGGTFTDDFPIWGVDLAGASTLIVGRRYNCTPGGASEAGGVQRPWYSFDSSGAGNSSANCCTLIGLTSTDCLRLTRVSATGTCACDDAEVDLLLQYDAGEWTTDETVEVCGVNYKPIFDFDGNGNERLGFETTTGGSGGETTYYLHRGCCCGTDCIEFIGGGEIFCTGDPVCPPNPPSENVVTYRIEYEICPNPDYLGEGWYCLDGEVVCVYYDEDPGLCAEILAGPFDEQTECDDVCGGDPPDPLPCQGVSFFGATATYTNKTGDCTCLPDAPAYSFQGTDTITFTTASCPGNVQLVLACNGGVYELTTGTGGITITLVSASASPLILVYDITGYGANCGGSGGSARFTIFN